MKQLSASAT